MQKIRIDFDNPGLPQHISAVENDSQSRFFQATLYENGKAYTAPEGAAYSIMYSGFCPQNQGWYDTINDGAGKRAACAVSGNVVTCEIARQALQAPGHVSIVLCVTTGKGYMIKSWPIECDCKNDRYDSTAEIESFFYITQVSNADWNRAIQALEDLKNTIDPTLSLSGKAADAKATGDAVGQLKEDVVTKLDKYAVGETELQFNNSGYVKSDGGEIIESPNAQNTGFIPICDVSKIIARVNLSDAGAKIAFFSGNKEYLKDISVISTGSNYEEIDLDITSDVYANAKYCIISNYGSETKTAKVIGIVAPYSVKATADEAKATADEAITPIRTTFFDEVNIGAPENVENVQRILYNDGTVNSVSDTWSLIFKCKPNTDYYIYIPDRNRRNVAESETDKFVDGETYTILPTSVINYSGVDIIKITTGENAKRIMFYYFNGSYDYDTNKDKIVIVKDKWTPNPYVHIPSKYLPKELFIQSERYGTFSIIGDSYSSFTGYMADSKAATWYPASAHGMGDTNDVETVEQTWWFKFANDYGSRLIENNSWSGSTISYDGYSDGLEDGKETSFIQRMSLLTTPQLILVYGGTNDSWAAVETKRDDFLGEYKYSDFSESDFIYFRPALAYLLDTLKHKHIGAKIVFMVNTTLGNIKPSVYEICSHYGVGVCEITGIALAHSHPTDAGMTTIANQITKFLETSN